MIFKDIKRWKVLKMRDNYVPGRSCTRGKTILVPICFKFYSAKTLNKGLLKKGLWIGGVLLFMILWICKIRLRIHRPDKVSHPNSSLSFDQLEPCHAPVTARAAWYRTLSRFSIRELKVGSWDGLIAGEMW